MDDWEICKLRDFVEINPKINLKKGNEYSFVEMKDLNPSQKFVVPSMTKPLSGGSKFRNGDTLFARITPCLENGKICQVKNLENTYGFGSTEFTVLRGKERISDNDFVYYMSRTENLRNAAIQHMTGTSGRQRVDKTGFENMEILVPINLTEQSRISSILSSLDDKIELNLQMNKTLEAIAQAIFKEWFVDFRFPGSDGVLVDGLPRGWKMVPISHIINVKDGTHESPKQKESGRFLITSKHIKDHYIDFRDAYYISNDDYISINKRSKVDSGDVLITMIGTVGNYYYVHENQVDFAIKNIGLFKTSERTDMQGYLFFFLKSQYTKSFYLKRTAGSTQQYLTLDTLRKTPVIIPEDRIMTAYNELSRIILNRILINQNEVKLLTELRDTLLPKLMTGKIRVA